MHTFSVCKRTWDPFLLSSAPLNSDVEGDALPGENVRSAVCTCCCRLSVDSGVSLHKDLVLGLERQELSSIAQPKAVHECLQYPLPAAGQHEIHLMQQILVDNLALLIYECSS